MKHYQPLLRQLLLYRVGGQPVLWFAFWRTIGPLSGIGFVWRGDLKRWLVGSDAWAVVLFGALSLLLATIWTAHIQTMLTQLEQPSAKLTPYLRRRLICLTVFLWLMASTVPALCLSLAYGHFWQLFAVTTTLILLDGHQGRHGIRTAIVLVVLLCFARGVMGEHRIDREIQAFARGDALTLIGAYCISIISALSFYFQVLRQRKEPCSALAPNRFARRFLDTASYRAAVQCAAKPGVSADKLLALGLGQVLHWSAVLRIQGLWVLMLLVPAWMGLPERAWIEGAILCGVLFFTLLMASHSVRGRLNATPAEQKLLRIAARTPGAAELNRVLARLCLKYFCLQAVGAIACIAIAIVVVYRGKLNAVADWNSVETALLITAVFCVALGYAFANYAALNKTNTVRDGWTTVLFMLAVAACFYGLSQLTAGHAIVSALLAALFVAACLFAYQRWRHMLSAPPAFPAGRFAA